MNEPNNLPKAISHKKLSLLMLKAKKDLSFSEEIYSENKELEEFVESLNHLEKVSKQLINKIPKKDNDIFNEKSSNSIMALGAMEVHLNMALQAINVFKNNSD
tara:strand:+ start:488 stop:796 length:309 start_codon:yes stop_codon:yes gene_type:complete